MFPIRSELAWLAGLATVLSSFACYGTLAVVAILGAIGVAIEVVDDFKDAGTSEASQGFRERRLQSDLRIPQGSADSPLHLIGKRAEVRLAGSHPAHGLRLSL